MEIRTRSAVLAIFLAVGSVSVVNGQAVAPPPSESEVFAPGTISVEGNNIYRGSFAPDGNAFYFFRKIDDATEDYRIFVSRRKPSAWSEPERVELGGEFSDLYPSVSPDGGQLVFSSYRPVPADTPESRNANLWIAERTAEGDWGPPRLLARASTLENYDAGASFGPDGSIRFVSTSPDWSTSTHLVTRRDANGYGPPEPDDRTGPWRTWRKDVHVWDVTFDESRDLAILDVSEVDVEGGRGPTDLWVSEREEHGWSEPRRLGARVNTPGAYENFVVFSPDGETLYFVRDFERYWRVSLAAALGR